MSQGGSYLRARQHAVPAVPFFEQTSVRLLEPGVTSYDMNGYHDASPGSGRHISEDTPRRALHGIDVILIAMGVWLGLLGFMVTTVAFFWMLGY